MNAFSSFLLGLVQGVAEFLPISSSGHLSIAQNLLHIDAEVPEFFDVLLHLGTLGAVFVAYWKDIKDMIAEFFRGIGDLAHRSTPKPLPPARRLILLIILGTLPLFAVLPIKDKVLGLSNNMMFIGGALIVTGFLLFASDRVKKGRKNERTASLLDAVAVGVSLRVLRGLRSEVRGAVFLPAVHSGGAGGQHPEPEGRRGGGSRLEPGAGVSDRRGHGGGVRVSVHRPAAAHRQQGKIRRVCLLLLGRGSADHRAAAH